MGDLINRIIGRGIGSMATASGWLLILLSVLVTFEIVARKFLDFSIQGVDEIGGYVLAIFSSIGFSFALVERAHIRIDLVHRHLPAVVQVVLNFIAFVLLGGFAVLLAWRAGAVAWELLSISAAAPTPLKTPLALPQGLWFLALLIFTLVVVIYLVHMAHMAFKGRIAEAAARYGISEVEDDVAQEMDAAKKRVLVADGAEGSQS